MVKNATLLVCLTAVAALAGCGDDEENPDASVFADASADAASPDAGTPDAPVPDATPPDARVCTALVAPDTGAPCDGDGDCGTGGVCLDEEEGWPAAGYCTRICVFDSECGDGGFCSDDVGGGTRVCLARCCGDAECGETGHSCQANLSGLVPLGDFACLPADEAAADGDACASFAECAPSSICVADPFETPGGYCLTGGCTIGDNSTCAPAGDGICVDLGGTPFCVDACSAPEDCRQGEGYTCVDVGAPIGGICLYDHADPGEMCTTDDDCGMPPWECLTGGGGAFPDGYCGADACDPDDDSTCPDATICYDEDPGTLDGSEFCAALCDPAADPSECRAGYACTDLGGGAFGCIVP